MNIIGTSGSDTLTGTSGNDVISGLDGNDTINASAGSDSIDGGSGNDQLIADLGNLTLFPTALSHYYSLTNTLLADGSVINSALISIERVTFTDTTGADSILNATGFSGSLNAIFGTGNHTITGGSSTDHIEVGFGTNSVSSGGVGLNGADFVTVNVDTTADAFGHASETPAGSVIVSYAHGANTGQTTASGFTGFSSIVVQSGVTGQGLYFDATNVFSGSALWFIDSLQDDVIIGSQASDRFAMAADGAGTLVGGIDRMTGNGGADIYDYELAIENANNDHILDFDADDTISLTYYSSLDGSFTDPDEPIFIGTAAFTGVAHQVRYEAVNGKTYIYTDLDGDGITDGTITIENGAFQLYDAQTDGVPNRLMIATPQTMINGTGGDEELTGTAGGDTIRAYNGDDTVVLTNGADFVDGGTGHDLLYADMSKSGSPGGQIFVIDTDRISNSTGSLSTAFLNVEAVEIVGDDQNNRYDASAFTGDLTLYAGNGNDVITGTSQYDSLYGDGGDDDIQGGDADDYIVGGDGDDTLDGGAGIDAVSYYGASAGVIVSLAITTAQDTVGAGADTVTGFEDLYGSAYDDTLQGDGSSNYLFGDDGDDLLSGGGGDALNGGDGFDGFDLDLSNVSTGVTGDLSGAFTATGVALGGVVTPNGGVVGGTTLVNFEYAIDVTLTTGNDTLTGIGSNVSEVNGFDGDDTLTGIAGSQTLLGGVGFDTLNGGDGDDILGGDSATDISLNNDTPADYDRTEADVLNGGAGDDSLYGGLNDTMDGGDGFDTFDLDLRRASLGITVDLSGAFTATGAVLQGRVLRNFEAADEIALTNFNDVVTLGGGDVDELYGLGGNDILTGGIGSQDFRGGDGNDQLNGGADDDSLSGETGNDTLNGGAGDDTMIGGAGSDIYVVDSAGDVVMEQASGGTDQVRTALSSYVLGANVENLTGLATSGQSLTGNGLANILTGGAGNDTLSGGLGNDVLTGGAGTDTASYADASAAVSVSLGITVAQDTLGAGVDTLAGIENLTGSAFADTLLGNASANSLSGGAGNDVLNAGAGNDVLAGGDGNDQVTGGAGDDSADGGVGFDTASYSSSSAGVSVSLLVAVAQNTGGGGTDTLAGFEALAGGSGGDTLTGTAGNNTLSGNGGNDHLVGGNGNDNLNGGIGNDVLDGGAGTDTAGYAAASAGVNVSLLLTGVQNTGGDGSDTLIAIENLLGSNYADTLTGDAGNNVLSGGSGADTLVGGAGNDTLDGGFQADTASYASATSGVTLNLNLGSPQVTGGAGTDTLVSIENVTGSAFADTLTGSAVNNVLTGGGGNDALNGRDGLDALHGGLGADMLTGGTGADTFWFDTALGATNIDTIADFSHADDTIYLDHTVFAGLAPGNLGTGALVLGATATSAASRILYDTTSGALFFDADGTGAGAAVQFATVTPGTTLQLNDFHVT